MEQYSESTLPNQLLGYRMREQMSQQQVADSLCVSRQTISKWEQGKSTPDASFIKKICELYQVSSDELLRIESTQEREVPAAASGNRSEKKKRRRRNIVLFLILDLLICCALVFSGGLKAFWVLNFNVLLFTAYFIYAVVLFFKGFFEKMVSHP